jgi:hypothetical protein
MHRLRPGNAVGVLGAAGFVTIGDAGFVGCLLVLLANYSNGATRRCPLTGSVDWLIILFAFVSEVLGG